MDDVHVMKLHHSNDDLERQESTLLLAQSLPFFNIFKQVLSKNVLANHVDLFFGENCFVVLDHPLTFKYFHDFAFIPIL